MRQLLPAPADPAAPVDGPERYRGDPRPSHADRPWLALNMVTSLDGATSVDDASAGLSGPADKAVFFALRSVADVVLAGAGTVRDEDYGPARLDAEGRARREARGQDPLPRLAVVTRRLDLDPGARLFTDPANPPIILTVAAADEDRRRALGEVADVVDCGETELDPRAALEALHRRGARVVLCEGGPVLNGHLVAAGLVDELCLTLSPRLVNGASARLAHGLALDAPQPLRLDRVLEEDGSLFLRYVRA